MNATEHDHRPTDRPLALALIAVPVLSLAAEAVSPPLRDGAAAQLAVIAAGPTRWYWYTVLLIAATAVLVPGALAVGRLGSRAAPRLALTGSVLVAASAIISVADAAEQLMSWQMVAPGADAGQMAALETRYDDAAGAAAVFLPGALALVAGTGLLTVALVLSRQVPRWAAVGFGLGMLVGLAGFMADSIPVIAAGALVLLPPALRMSAQLAGRRPPVVAREPAASATA